jgi:hypothetical protein
MNWVCVEDALADQNKDLPENIKTALLLYYTHIINKDQDKDMHRLMATDMNNMRSDLLYFDCFHIPNFGLSKYLPLMSISNLDKKINRFKKHGGRQSLPIDDDRPNHMNDKNNRIFAQKITHWINTSQFEMDITEFSKED